MAIVGGKEFRFQRVMYILKRRMVDMCVLNNVSSRFNSRPTGPEKTRSIVVQQFCKFIYSVQ
jgi:hypothetical protein